MPKIIKHKYISDLENVKNVWYDNNVLYFFTTFGPEKFHMPNFFFIKHHGQKKISIILDNYNKYNMVFRQIVRIFSRSYRVYFFKLKLRGLGYKLWARINRRIIKFFFAYNHFFYLYIPKNIFFRRIKRKFFFILIINRC